MIYPIRSTFRHKKRRAAKLNKRPNELQKRYPWVIKADVGLKTAPSPDKPGAKKGVRRREIGRHFPEGLEANRGNIRGDFPQMNSREKRMAIGVASLVGLLVLYFIYATVVDKFTQRENKIAELQQTLTKNRQTITDGNVSKRGSPIGTTVRFPATKR